MRTWVSLAVACVFIVGAGKTTGQTKMLRRADGYTYDSQEKKARLNALHAAGLKRDISCMPALLEVVSNPPDDFHLYTALHALGRLGDSQAFAALDSVMKDINDGEARGLAQAVRARLCAQLETSSLADPQDQEAAKAWTDRFLGELKITPAEINKGVALYIDRSKRSMHAEITRETFALRQLADQIYVQRNAPLLRLATERGIDFRADVASAYKVQLALLNPRQRVDWIVATLANCKEMTGDDFFLMQLATDEGQITRQAIIVKLKEMNQDRHKYAIVIPGSNLTYYPGIGALLRILSAIADKQDVKLVAAYVKDSEQLIRHYALRAEPYIESGVAWRPTIGY
jgi:hypothetical protein